MFGATFTNATLEKEAKEICGDDKFCLFDIAATGRVEIGAATMEEVKMVETIEEMTKPSKFTTQRMNTSLHTCSIIEKTLVALCTEIHTYAFLGIDSLF